MIKQLADSLADTQAIAPVPGSVVRSRSSQTNMKYRYIVVIDSFTGDVRRLETREPRPRPGPGVPVRNPYAVWTTWLFDPKTKEGKTEATASAVADTAGACA